MDPEHGFDSDTSESWSIIDVNDNEHGSIVELTERFDANVTTSLQCCTADTLFDENVEVNPHSQQCDNAVQGIKTANCSNNSPDTASLSTVHPDCQILYKGKVFQNDYSLGKKSSDLSCSKTSFNEAGKVEVDNKLKVSFSDFDNDTDCISVISESEYNDLKFSAYETDEICDEKLSESNVSGKPNPNILKRKRKRLKLNYRESSEDSISSDFMIPDGKYYSSIQNFDYKKSNNEMELTGYQSAPVYRHYRNNVANTMLTLAMGVIFTGVACIAVGHFLGVHDAQQTAGEMMESLKRLQMENVLLHTRLTQLSRAFFSRGSSKLEFRANVEPQNCLDKYLKENIDGVNENKLNDVSPIKNSIYFRGGSFDVSTNLREPVNELSHKESQDYYKVKVLDENHDQLDYMNVSKYEEKYYKPTYSSTTPIKVGYVSKKLLSPGNNLQDELNRKFRKRSRENKDCREMNEQFENGYGKQDCLAVREKDLSRFQWFIIQKKKKKRNARLNEAKVENEDSDGGYLYKFPQPEEFYKYEEVDKSYKRCGDKLELEKRDDEFKSVRFPTDKPSDSVHFSTKSERDGRKDGALAKKKHSPKPKKEKKDEGNDLDDVEFESLKKGEKFEKGSGNTSKRMRNHEGNFSNRSKKFKPESTKKNCKLRECRKKGEKECNFKPHSKRSKDTTLSMDKFSNDGRKNGRNKEKYLKGEKTKRTKPEKEDNSRLHKRQRNFRERKPFSVLYDMKFANQSDCEGCGNKTAGWEDKRAKGRERCRRNQKISQWLFDRAKSRADSRIGDAYWQFNRALARESSRKEAYIHFRKKGMKHKGFFSDAYSWI